MFWAKPGTNERLESSGLGTLEGLFHAHVDLSFAEACILNARLSQLKFPCIPQKLEVCPSTKEVLPLRNTA